MILIAASARIAVVMTRRMMMTIRCHRNPLGASTHLTLTGALTAQRQRVFVRPTFAV